MPPKNENAHRPGWALSTATETSGRLSPQGAEVKDRQPAWPGDDAPPMPLDAVAVPPWPDDALPPAVGAFVDAVAASVQVPRDLAGMVALGVMSACWAGKVRALPFGEYREPLSVYAVAAADVGERKSATYAAMEAPLLLYQQERQAELAPLWSDYEAERSLLDAQLGMTIQKGRTVHDLDDGESSALDRVRTLRRKRDELRKPPRADFITGDCTAEGLSRLMSETGGHACLMSPEGGGIFDLIGGRYDKVPNLDAYLKGYDGERITVTRANREREYPPVAMPALVMVVTTQPATLRKLAKSPDLADRGLLARMIYAVPAHSLVGYRKPIGPTVSDSVRKTYDDLIGWALRIDRPEVPHDLAFDAEALEAYKALAADIERHLRPGGALCGAAGWGNKLTGKIVRLAALYHLMSKPDDREPWRIPVTAAAFQRAARLRDYLVAHALRAFGLMQEPREVSAARKLMTHLAQNRRQRFTTRDAQRFTDRNGTAEATRRTLELLAAHRHIARLTGSRHDSEVWVVHPAIVATWETRPDASPASQAGTVGTLR